MSERIIGYLLIVVSLSISSLCVVIREDAAHAILPPRPLRIANLGDSYASGPGIAPVLSADCERSGLNYGHVAANILKATLYDVTCSGAVSNDFYRSQIWLGRIIARPQFTALTGHEDVVLVSIGGNDAQLVNAFSDCGYQQFTWWGCHSELMDVQEHIKSEVRNKLTDIYRQIRDKDPRAEIIAVGYGSILGNSWCVNAPFGPQTRSDMQTTLDLMNRTIKQSITSIHGIYFDAKAATRGHDLCSYRPWYYGLLPGNINAGYIGHPNISAMNVEGRALADLIRRTWTE